MDSMWDVYRRYHCYNGIQDYDEEGVDCGGSCIRDMDGDWFYIAYCEGDSRKDAEDCDVAVKTAHSARTFH